MKNLPPNLQQLNLDLEGNSICMSADGIKALVNGLKNIPPYL